MIHDPTIEITCDDPDCNESVFYTMPYKYRTLSANSGFYDSNEKEILMFLIGEDWKVIDGKHYCYGCAEEGEDS